MGYANSIPAFWNSSINGTACGRSSPLTGCPTHGAEDIPKAIQEASSDTFVSALELMLRNGDTFAMAEVRTASSPGEQPH